MRKLSGLMVWNDPEYGSVVAWNFRMNLATAEQEVRAAYETMKGE